MKRRGFTLIELMIVVSIIGVLSAIVVPKLMQRAQEAKITAAKMQIKNFKTALEMFYLDNGFYPSTEQGLQALVKKPATGREPKHYRKDGYMDKVPLDPWGNPYIYRCPGEHGAYDIISYGADGEPGGEGANKDITSW